MVCPELACFLVWLALASSSLIWLSLAWFGLVWMVRFGSAAVPGCASWRRGPPPAWRRGGRPGSGSPSWCPRPPSPPHTASLHACKVIDCSPCDSYQVAIDQSCICDQCYGVRTTKKLIEDPFIVKFVVLFLKRYCITSWFLGYFTIRS